MSHTRRVSIFLPSMLFLLFLIAPLRVYADTVTIPIAGASGCFSPSGDCFGGGSLGGGDVTLPVGTFITGISVTGTINSNPEWGIGAADIYIFNARDTFITVGQCLPGTPCASGTPTPFSYILSTQELSSFLDSTSRLDQYRSGLRIT